MYCMTFCLPKQCLYRIYIQSPVYLANVLHVIALRLIALCTSPVPAAASRLATGCDGLHLIFTHRFPTVSQGYCWCGTCSMHLWQSGTGSALMIMLGLQTKKCLVRRKQLDEACIVNAMSHQRQREGALTSSQPNSQP